MHIIIAGSGTTNRKNIEALLGDYLDAHPDAILVLPAFRSIFSTHQLQASEFFESRGLKSVIITREEVDYEFYPYSTREETIGKNDDIMGAAAKYIKGQKEGMFILWNDDDAFSLALLSAAVERGVTAHDLTNGLIAIDPPADLKLEEDRKFPDDEVIEEDEDEDDEEEEEPDNSGITISIADMTVATLAKAVAEEVVRLLKEGR